MSILAELQNLSSAEEFFDRLGVDYAPEVVHVARLHILRRMGEYIAGSARNAAFRDIDDAGVEALCREHLAHAYADFVSSTPIEQRLFKVHRDAVRPKAEAQKPFVPLESLTSRTPAEKGD